MIPKVKEWRIRGRRSWIRKETASFLSLSQTWSRMTPLFVVCCGFPEEQTKPYQNISSSRVLADMGSELAYSSARHSLTTRAVQLVQSERCSEFLFTGEKATPQPFRGEMALAGSKYLQPRRKPEDKAKRTAQLWSKPGVTEAQATFWTSLPHKLMNVPYCFIQFKLGLGSSITISTGKCGKNQRFTECCTMQEKLGKAKAHR